MKYIYRTFLSLLLIGLSAGAARADAIDWSSTLQFSVEAGFESPLVLFGFNPQPEPPPLYTAAGFIDPAVAVQELSGIEPTPFLLYLAADGGSFSFPPEPVIDFDRLNIGFTTIGGVDLIFALGFTPMGDGDASTGISDPLFFNPQPEPPPQYASSIGFQFAFEGLTSGDTVAISLQVLDESGRALNLTAVPIPPALVLMFSGMLMLAGAARKRA